MRKWPQEIAIFGLLAGVAVPGCSQISDLSDLGELESEEDSTVGSLPAESPSLADLPISDFPLHADVRLSAGSRVRTGIYLQAGQAFRLEVTTDIESRRYAGAGELAGDGYPAPWQPPDRVVLELGEHVASFVDSTSGFAPVDGELVLTFNALASDKSLKLEAAWGRPLVDFKPQLTSLALRSKEALQVVRAPIESSDAWREIAQLEARSRLRVGFSAGHERRESGAIVHGSQPNQGGVRSAAFEDMTQGVVLRSEGSQLAATLVQDGQVLQMPAGPLDSWIAAGTRQAGAELQLEVFSSLDQDEALLPWSAFSTREFFWTAAGDTEMRRLGMQVERGELVRVEVRAEGQAERYFGELAWPALDDDQWSQPQARRFAPLVQIGVHVFEVPGVLTFYAPVDGDIAIGINGCAQARSTDRSDAIAGCSPENWLAIGSLDWSIGRVGAK